jgi:hypothetical protein
LRESDAYRQSVKKLPLSPINILKNICTKDLFFVVLTMQHITRISHQALQMRSLEEKMEQKIQFDLLMPLQSTSRLESLVL